MNEVKSYVEHYLNSRASSPDTWILHCSARKELNEAIFCAALAQNHLRKRHPHQFRRSRQTLEKFAYSICHSITEMQKVDCFEDIYQLVEARKVHDIGPLTIYDTAQRIGAFLGIHSDKIYLHSGTKLGAEKILGRRLRQSTLDWTELPKAFQDPRLTCADLEDILCHLNGAKNIQKQNYGLGYRIKSTC